VAAAARKQKREDYFICPHCGAEVPARSWACPQCGSDEKTGWSDGAGEAGAGADDDFDYEEFLRREFPSNHCPKFGRRPALFVALTVLALIAALTWLLFLTP
jgi:ribosomal protein L40E